MRAVLALAHYTGWSLAEISDMTTDDLADWVTTIPNRK